MNTAANNTAAATTVTKVKAGSYTATIGALSFDIVKTNAATGTAGKWMVVGSDDVTKAAVITARENVRPGGWKRQLESFQLTLANCKRMIEAVAA